MLQNASAGVAGANAAVRSGATGGVNGHSPQSASPPNNHPTRGLRVNVNVANPPLLEENGIYDDEARDEAMALVSAQDYDDMDIRAAYIGGPGGSGGGASPIEGGSTSGEDTFGMINMTAGGMGGSMGIIGKPIGTNNFVTKLYQ